MVSNVGSYTERSAFFPRVRYSEPGHGDGITAGLSERGRENLDDPEAECDFRDLSGTKLRKAKFRWGYPSLVLFAVPNRASARVAVNVEFRFGGGTIGRFPGGFITRGIRVSRSGRN
jgi:hypothetical protein